MYTHTPFFSLPAARTLSPRHTRVLILIPCVVVSMGLSAPLFAPQYLDSEDSTKPIYLYVNCPGGSVIAGLALFDTMQHIRSEVVTINVGLAASMASFILAAGAKVRHERVGIGRGGLSVIYITFISVPDCLWREKTGNIGVYVK